MAPHRAFLGVLLVAVGGCAEDPPAAESDIRTIVMSASTDAPPSRICEPAEERECKLFWTSPEEPGIQHCAISTQVCADDGRSWSACGAVAN